MIDKPEESQKPRIEGLMEDITGIIALHMCNIRVFVRGPENERKNLILGINTEQAFRGQIGRAVERIVEEVLVRKLQPGTVPKRGEMPLQGEALRDTMLGLGKLQELFLHIYADILLEGCDLSSPVALKELKDAGLMFDREFAVVLAGGDPEEIAREKAEEAAGRGAGTMADKALQHFADSVRATGGLPPGGCPLGKKSPDQ